MMEMDLPDDDPGEDSVDFKQHWNIIEITRNDGVRMYNQWCWPVTIKLVEDYGSTPCFRHFYLHIAVYKKNKSAFKTDMCAGIVTLIKYISSEEVFFILLQEGFKRVVREKYFFWLVTGIASLRMFSWCTLAIAEQIK